ncbi:hypothetical protein MAPG_01547 [Magnaporthiopsis poae ATCC 64411]|uniref:Chromo domain-containing protein n=1 Tax=Magnaporthiopsis poae (strain ATCC 64411 / 73-15) TaxID=644358 RepID=A0A0C4DNZ8_MAGP6|nr:hypothetical protein MAPG_01547 [Magnaporthiopsis poae ATCC 64411]
MPKKKLVRGLPPRDGGDGGDQDAGTLGQAKQDSSSDDKDKDQQRNPSPSPPPAPAPAPARPGPSSRRRQLYASWLDKARVPCNADGTPQEPRDMGGVVQILNHRVRVHDEEDDQVEMLVLWDKDLGRANSWEAEEALHRDQHDMLLEYWASVSPGGREATLDGSGHESTVFALWYPLAREEGHGQG